MPARRVIARIELDRLDEGMKQATRILKECADRMGSPYVEKVSPSAIEVGCVYETEEEGIVVQEAGAKYEYRYFQLELPEELDTEAKYVGAVSKLEEFRKFVRDCLARGGRVELTRSAKSVEPGRRIPNVVVTCARRL